MSSGDALEEEHCVQWPQALNGASWSQNNRLSVDGHAVTFMVFGIIDDCVWHTALDSPVELRIRLRFLRESDQDIHIKLYKLAGANGKPMCIANGVVDKPTCPAPSTPCLDASLSTQSPNTVFASLYDSIDGVRARGMRKGAALNIMRAGDVIRLDVGC